MERRSPARRILRGLLVAAFGLALLAGSADGSGSGHATALPRVTVIGDSVADAIAYDRVAQATLAEGVDLRLELAPCRRVGQSSCPYDGVRPPTVVELVPVLGAALGDTVIVAVGYNDFEPAYAGNMEDALTALRKVGVTRVLWVTLRETRPSYATMNDSIRSVAARHSEVTVVDWNLYSRSHPDWVQADGLHLTAGGAQAMAMLFHNLLTSLGVPVVPAPPPPKSLAIVSSRLPEGREGVAYSARLLARGGVRPYRWSRVLGSLPRGLRLTAKGEVRGVPILPGTFVATVRVRDARGASSTRRLLLRIQR